MGSCLIGLQARYLAIEELDEDLSGYQQPPLYLGLGGLDHTKITTRYPDVADFMAYLQLKNLSARTLIEYQKVLRSLFNHVGLGDSSPTRITAA